MSTSFRLSRKAFGPGAAQLLDLHREFPAASRNVPPTPEICARNPAGHPWPRIRANLSKLGPTPVLTVQTAPIVVKASLPGATAGQRRRAPVDPPASPPAMPSGSAAPA